MPKENDKKPFTLTERLVATVETGALTTYTRGFLNLAAQHTNFRDLITATRQEGFKNIKINVPRTVAAVFSQMYAIEQTKKQFGEDAKLTAVMASATTGGLIATGLETYLIRMNCARQECPTAHFKKFTIVSHTMPPFSWNKKSYRLPFMYAIREFLFTVTVLTNETHLSTPKNREELLQFSYNLGKQITLYSTGAFFSACAHKLIVPTAAQDIFAYANKGTVPNIDVDGIVSTLKKLSENDYTHPSFQGSYANPTNFMQKLNNLAKALCGTTMFGARVSYLVTTCLIVRYSLETTQKLHNHLNAFFSNRQSIPISLQDANKGECRI